MKINYRVLSYNEKDHSMLVRYWTDILSEDDLAVIFDEYGKIVYNANGYPVRTSTDVNISFYNNPNPSEEDILNKIKQSAQASWLYNLEQTKTSNTEYSLANVATFVGETKNMEIDIDQLNQIQIRANTSLLDRNKMNIEIAAKVAIRYIQTGVYDLGNTGSYII